jgi:hypothetical protein
MVTGSVWIPNQEVRLHWEQQVIELLKSTLNPQFQERLSSAVRAVPFDINSLENVMRDMLQYCSFHDLTLENSYHIFYFGSLFTILHNGKTIDVSSNKEAGHGRYHICINLTELKRVIIIEFKKSKSEKAMAGDAKMAVQQVQEKNYSSGLRDCEFIIVGISFFGKLMSSPEYESIKI